MSAWLLLALVLLPAEALACATCVGAPWQKTDAGFYWSALFLMGVPFAVAGIIGGWLFYHSRRAQPTGGKWGWLRSVGTGIDIRAEGRRPSLGGGLRPPSDTSPLNCAGRVSTGEPWVRARSGEAGPPRGEAGINLRKEGIE